MYFYPVVTRPISGRKLMGLVLVRQTLPKHHVQVRLQKQ